MSPTRLLRPASVFAVLALLTLPTSLATTTVYEEDYLVGAHGGVYGEECGTASWTLDPSFAGACFNLGGTGVNRTAQIDVDDDVNDNVLVMIQFGVYAANGELRTSATGPHGSLIEACSTWSGSVPDWADGVKVAVYNAQSAGPNGGGCDVGVSGTITLTLTEP